MTVETRYMTSDDSDITDFKKLSTTNTASAVEKTCGDDGNLTAYVGIRIRKRDSNGNFTTLVDWTEITITETSYTEKQIDTTVPETQLSSDERIDVDVRIRTGTASIEQSFITEAIQATFSGTWNHKVWVYKNYNSFLDMTNVYFKFGDGTYNSRVENFQYTQVTTYTKIFGIDTILYSTKRQFGIDAILKQYETYLYPHYFDNSLTSGWDTSGTSPYIDINLRPDNNGEEVSCNTDNAEIGDWEFAKLLGGKTVKSVTLEVMFCTSVSLISLRIKLWNGLSWLTVEKGSNDWSWKTEDVTSHFDTIEKLNAAKLRLEGIYGNVDLIVDCVRLKVQFEPEQQKQYTIDTGNGITTQPHGQRKIFKNPRGLGRFYAVYYKPNSIYIARSMKGYVWTTQEVKNFGSDIYDGADVTFYEDNNNSQLVVLFTYTDTNGNCWFRRAVIPDNSETLSFDSEIQIFSADSDNKAFKSKIVVSDSGYFVVVYERKYLDGSDVKYDIRCKLSTTTYPVSPTFSSEQTIYTADYVDRHVYFTVTTVGWKGYEAVIVYKFKNQSDFTALGVKEIDWDGTTFSVPRTDSVQASVIEFNDRLNSVNRPNGINPKVDIVVTRHPTTHYELVNKRYTPSTDGLSAVWEFPFRSTNEITSLTSVFSEDRRIRTAVFSVSGEDGWLYFAVTDTIQWLKQTVYKIPLVGLTAVNYISVPHNDKEKWVRIIYTSGNEIKFTEFHTPSFWGNTQRINNQSSILMYGDYLKIAFGFMLDQTRTINKIIFRGRQFGNAGTIRVGIQKSTSDWSAPDGTWVGYTDITLPDTDSFITANVNITLTKTELEDEKYFVVIEPLTSGDVSNHAIIDYVQPIRYGTPLEDEYMLTSTRDPFVCTYDGSNWNELSDATPILIFEYSDSSQKGYPYYNIYEKEIYGNNYVAERIKFNNNAENKVNAIEFYAKKVGSPADDLYFRIEKIDGTEILGDTTVLTASEASSSYAKYKVYFPIKSLKGDLEYRLIFKSPTSEDSSNCYIVNACQTEDTYKSLSFDGSTSYLETYDGSSWTQHTEKDLSFRLLVFEGTYTLVIKTFKADVLFKKLGITKSFPIDSLFKKTDISKTFTVDADFLKTGITKMSTIDILLKKVGMKTFAIDILLKKYVRKKFLLGWNIRIETYILLINLVDLLGISKKELKISHTLREFIKIPFNSVWKILSLVSRKLELTYLLKNFKSIILSQIHQLRAFMYSVITLVFKIKRLAKNEFLFVYKLLVFRRKDFIFKNSILNRLCNSLIFIMNLRTYMSLILSSKYLLKKCIDQIEIFLFISKKFVSRTILNIHSLIGKLSRSLKLSYVSGLFVEAFINISYFLSGKVKKTLTFLSHSFTYVMEEILLLQQLKEFRTSLLSFVSKLLSRIKRTMISFYVTKNILEPLVSIFYVLNQFTITKFTFVFNLLTTQFVFIINSISYNFAGVLERLLLLKYPLKEFLSSSFRILNSIRIFRRNVLRISHWIKSYVLASTTIKNNIWKYVSNTLKHSHKVLIFRFKSLLVNWEILEKIVVQIILFSYSSVGRVFGTLRVLFSVGLMKIYSQLVFSHRIWEFVIVAIYRLKQFSPVFVLKSLRTSFRTIFATLKYKLKKYIKRREL